jgi:hypothetical protein
VRFRLGAHGAAVQRRVDALAAAGVAGRIWSRDAALWGGDAFRQASVASRLGWLDIAPAMRAEAADLEAFARETRDDGVTDVVLLLMGCSSV